MRWMFVGLLIMAGSAAAGAQPRNRSFLSDEDYLNRRGA